MGYYMAGFTDITGVDHNPQPRYPFKFKRGDWRDVDLSEYDFIHASPPCQAFLVYTQWNRSLGRYDNYQNLIGPVRAALKTSKKPYVIENVVGAPLERSVMLCGTMFDLRVFRHRIFETSFPVLRPKHPKHPKVNGYLKHNRGYNDHGMVGIFGNFSAPLEYARFALGINWMNRKELSQAIPPVFTKYIGEQYLKRSA